MRFYTSPKFWISDFSNLSPADYVLMSIYVVFFSNDLVKIMTEFYALRNLKILDDHDGHEIGSANEILRFSTIFKDMRPRLKSITNWIWFENALIY